MKNVTFYVLLLTTLCLVNCTPKVNCKKFSSITFCTDELKLLNEESLSEGVMGHYKLGDLNIKIISSYYSDNLYEYDIVIVHPSDTVQINSLRDNNIPYIIAADKKSVDLDYHRKYNVYFDTVSNIPIKLLEPRYPFSKEYICFIAKVPNSYRKNIGYKSLTIICDNISSEQDLEKFKSFIKSMRG